MTHRGPFQPLPFCDSVKQPLTVNASQRHAVIQAGSSRSVFHVCTLQSKVLEENVKKKSIISFP